jgi:N-acetylglucosaminyl-diphospho-decaprenol L-rhamnosyltransferase
MTTSIPGEIPVIIVAFRNAQDVKRCTDALAHVVSDPPLAIFICENGGVDAFADLVAVLAGPEGTCDPDDLPPMPSGARLVRTLRLRLRTSDPSKPACVHVGEARENLGFAGGVNAYLEPLLASAEWPGVWILNPDTEPEPNALRELVLYAAKHNLDMVGSRQRPRQEPGIVLGQGLAWRKWRAAARLVDSRDPGADYRLPEAIDPRLDSPSGASMYVTHNCIKRIGLMDERYFLYFEDLDWGLRAKRHGLIGHAPSSIVVHEGGTTIGGGISRRGNSPLSVYLEFRNRLLFTRVHFPKWLVWTFFVEIVEILEYARNCAFHNMSAAFRGAAAGLVGRIGRPEQFMRTHRTPTKAK